MVGQNYYYLSRYEQCSSYESLEEGNSEPFVNGTFDSYRTVECKLLDLFHCFATWCLTGKSAPFGDLMKCL